ncbi:MAG: tetratricopeptide repeat protein [Desulfobacter sp.]|nr:MAG: tetratricopeptide repeat protein [Desulfobacter sp.]
MTEQYRYPGSNPFSLEFRSLFFGREKEINELSTLINVEKLVVLHGKSGLGKSSLLNAGLLPELEDEKGYLIIQVRFTAYKDEKQALSNKKKVLPINILSEAISEFSKPDNFLNRIENKNISPWQELKNIQYEHPDKKQILLVFDQFEELFTYPEDAVNNFVRMFFDILKCRMPKHFRRTLELKLLKEPSFLTENEVEFLYESYPLKTIFSIRSDKMFLMNQLSTLIPLILRRCYELNPLSEKQAKKAIVLPAQKEGAFVSRRFTFQDQALEKMLAYLGRQNEEGKNRIEPFQLQLLCQHFEKRFDRKETRNKDKNEVTLNDLGGDKGLQNIMESFYDTEIGRLPSFIQRRRARRLCEKKLIMDGWRVSQHRKVIKQQLKLTEDTLKQLVDARLLRQEKMSTGITYELSHDTLIQPILKSGTTRRKSWLYPTVFLVFLLVSTLIGVGIWQWPTYRWPILINQIEQSKNPEKTKQKVERAVALNPGQRSKVYRLALNKFLEKNWDLDQALEYARRIEEEKGGHLDLQTYLALGSAFLKANRKEEALAQYIKAHEVSNQNINKLIRADTYFFMGMMSLDSNNLDRADTYIELGINAAQQDNAQNPGTLLKAMAYAYLKKGKEKEAIRYFKRSVEIAPHQADARTYRFIGNYCLKTGDEDKAIAHYSNALGQMAASPGPEAVQALMDFQGDLRSRLVRRKYGQYPETTFLKMVGFDPAYIQVQTFDHSPTKRQTP